MVGKHNIYDINGAGGCFTESQVAIMPPSYHANQNAKYIPEMEDIYTKGKSINYWDIPVKSGHQYKKINILQI